MGKTSSKKEESKHADRKFEKKLEFYAKVRDAVAEDRAKAALGAQKTIKKKKIIRSRQKKLKAYNLSSLLDVLPDLEPQKQPTPSDFKVTSKSRQKLVMKESNQLKAVLDHPGFKADPLAALHQHLQSTQPVIEKPVKKRETGKKGRKKKIKKKKGSKGASGSQSMEE